MKLHAPPFDSVTDEMLFGLAMGGEACAVEQVQFGATLIGLSKPLWTEFRGKIRYAIACLIAPAAANPGMAAYFSECQQDYSGQLLTLDTLRAQGMPLGHLGIYEIKGTANLERFTICSADATVCELRLQYFW